jgi:hypothetical protein
MLRGFTHRHLVTLAARWLRDRQHCSVIITEMTTYARETPDAIGWHGHQSTLIECKASRDDFMANRNKNSGPGMGHYRLFLMPQGLVTPSEVPDGWGLLEWDGRMIRTIVSAHARKDYSRDDELLLLLSAIRRVGPSATGVSCRMYCIETKNRATLGIELLEKLVETRVGLPRDSAGGPDGTVGGN